MIRLDNITRLLSFINDNIAPFFTKQSSKLYNNFNSINDFNDHPPFRIYIGVDNGKITDDVIRYNRKLSRTVLIENIKYTIDKLNKFSGGYYKSGKFVIFITMDSSDFADSIGFTTKKLKIKDVIFILRKLLEKTHRIPDEILNNYF